MKIPNKRNWEKSLTAAKTNLCLTAYQLNVWFFKARILGI